MKNFNRTFMTAALVVASLVCGGRLQASDHPITVTHADAPAAEGQPTSCNKASSVLGMEVRNQKHETLGKIQDIVFDLKSERVSYAVLEVNGAKGKLVAVPLSALTPGEGNDHLVLRADKAKLTAAVGIQGANWPSVTNPSWGSQNVVSDETATPAATWATVRATGHAR